MKRSIDGIGGAPSLQKHLEKTERKIGGGPGCPALIKHLRISY